MPGPDIDLSREMKRSGLSAICMTFATDCQPGDAYDRFLKAWRRWIGSWNAAA
jgi:membrane dipeptidase